MKYCSIYILVCWMLLEIFNCYVLLCLFDTLDIFHTISSVVELYTYSLCGNTSNITISTDSIRVK